MKLLHILFLLSLTITGYSQTNQNSSATSTQTTNSNAIESEFIKIYKNSNNWQAYKMIKRVDFISFQKRVLDSVSRIKKSNTEKQNTIIEQNNTIQGLNNKISDLSQQLDDSINQKDSINLLGMGISKATYNTIMWFLVLILLAGLLFFMFRFKNSNILTKKAQAKFNDLEQEHEEYRKRSLEREQKLRRQLQDEINKQRGV